MCVYCSNGGSKSNRRTKSVCGATYVISETMFDRIVEDRGDTSKLEIIPNSRKHIEGYFSLYVDNFSSELTPSKTGRGGSGESTNYYVALNSSIIPN